VYVTVGQDTLHGRGPGALTCIDAASGKVLWQSTAVDRSLATVSVVAGLVYVTDYSGRVHCLDARTGQSHWQHATESPLWSSTLVAGNKILLGTEKRDFWILQTGRELKVLNKIRFPDRIYNTPVIAQGVLYIATERYLYAIGE
jgi:outer membrane protein assembly factor BamB